MAALLGEHNQKRQGDHFRALYGRLCEGLTAREVADAVGLSLTQSKGAYKQAVACLQSRVRRHVEGYCAGGRGRREVSRGVGSAGGIPAGQRGLEQAVRKGYHGLAPRYGPESKSAAVRSRLLRLADRGAGARQPGSA